MLEYKELARNNFYYISPICPEASSGWICTKYGLRGPLADIIQCDKFFVDRFRGFDFVRVDICSYCDTKQTPYRPNSALDQN